MSPGISKENDSRKRLRAILDRHLDVYGTQSWNRHTRQPPCEALIGAVLSHRAREGRTDDATRALLARYPCPRDLAVAPLETIERLIRPSNDYRVRRPALRRFAGFSSLVMGARSRAMRTG